MSALSPFYRLPPIPSDPIFAAAKRAKAAGKDAINGTIGVILDEDGSLLLFPSVRKALGEIDMNDTGYPPLEGLPDYLASVRSLVFPWKEAREIPACATAGGTSAVSTLLHLAKRAGYDTALVPVPTWPNHMQLLRAAGMEWRECPYVRDGKATLATLIELVRTQSNPCVLILQAGCHNPSGLDPVISDWQALADALKDSPHAVIMDLAYQGLGESVEKDTEPMRILEQANVPILIAWSASKNHCMYGLRAGAALIDTRSDEHRDLFAGQLAMMNRALSSVAPVTGQRVVARVQTAYAQEWEADLSALRGLLTKKRAMLAEALPHLADSIVRTRGLFVQLPLTPAHIVALEQKNVFMNPDGRVNIAATATKRVRELGEEIGKIVA